jgi:hypothetical protein
MGGFTKDRVLRLAGSVLVCAGVLVHLQAEKWATCPYPASIDPAGKAMYVDPHISGFFTDAGMVMMILGGIAVTLGMVGWIYPSQQFPAEERATAGSPTPKL